MKEKKKVSVVYLTVLIQHFALRNNHILFLIFFTNLRQEKGTLKMIIDSSGSQNNICKYRKN